MMSADRTGEARSPEEESGRWLALWEIISVTLTFLLLVWVVLPLGDYDKRVAALFTSITFLYLLAAHRLRGETARALGLRTDNFMRALRLTVLFAALAAPLLVLLGVSLRAAGLPVAYAGRKSAGWPGSDHTSAELLWRGLKLFSGLTQQYVLQGFINRRAQVVWGKGLRSVLIVAAIFALWHLPNPWLMLATFAGGAAWAAIYQREPNLYALGLSHAFASWLLVSSVPSSVFNNLKVGLRYFE